MKSTKVRRAPRSAPAASILLLFFVSLFFTPAEDGYAAPSRSISIVFSGEARGRFWPDPLSGSGGLGRQASRIRELLKKNPGTIVVDTGNSLLGVSEPNAPAGMPFIIAMNRMGYRAANISYRDFRLGARGLKEKMAKARFPFVSANIIDNSTRELFAKPYTIIQAGDVSVGIIGLTRKPAGLAFVPHLQKQLQGVKIENPEKALAKYLPAVKKEAKFIILLSYLKRRNNFRIAEKFKGIDIILEGGVPGPPDRFTRAGNTFIATAPRGADYLGRLEVRLSSDNKIASARSVPIFLSKDVPEDPEVASIVPARPFFEKRQEAKKVPESKLPQKEPAPQPKIVPDTKVAKEKSPTPSLPEKLAEKSGSAEKDQAPAKEKPDSGIETRESRRGKADESTERVNLALRENGGKVESVTSEGSSFYAAYLIDGGVKSYGWRAKEKKFPQEVVFSFFDKKVARIDGVVLHPQFSFGNERDWLHQFEVWTSAAEKPDPGTFRRAGQFLLKTEASDQLFSFSPVSARFLKLKILSNYGGFFIGMGEVGVLEAREDGYTSIFKGARARLVQAGELKERVNLSLRENGGKIEAVTSEGSSFNAAYLIDGGVKSYGWRAKEKKFPQEVVFSFFDKKVARIDGVVLHPQFSFGNERDWPQQFELWISAAEEPAANTFRRAGRYLLNKEAADQLVSFAPVSARYLKLKILSNHGGSFIGMGEVGALEAREDGYVSILKGAKGRMAKSGEFADRVNLTLSDFGGKFERDASIFSEYDASWRVENLIDGGVKESKGWSSKDAKMSQELVFSFWNGKKTLIDTVVLNPKTAEGKDRWAREFEIWISETSKNSGFKKSGRFILSREPGDQVFSFEPAWAKFVKLKVLSNHGGSFIQLGEFQVLESKSQNNPSILAGVMTQEVKPGELKGRTNLAYRNLGGRIAEATSYDSGYEPEYLIDGRVDTKGWFAKEKKFPQEIVIRFYGKKEARIDGVLLNPKIASKDSKKRVHRFEVWTSRAETLEPSSFKLVGAYLLRREAVAQIVSFGSVPARYVKIKVLSNYGGSEVGLGEVQVFEAREDGVPSILKFKEGPNIALAHRGGEVLEEKPINYLVNRTLIDGGGFGVLFRPSSEWIFSFANEDKATVNRILIYPSSGCIPENFRLSYSGEAAPGKFVPILSSSLLRKDEGQWIVFDPVEARFIKVRFKSDYGEKKCGAYEGRSTYSAGLQEIEIYEYLERKPSILAGTQLKRNLASPMNAGAIIRYSSQINENTRTIARLIDNSNATKGWASGESARLPHEIVFGFKENLSALIDQIRIDPRTKDKKKTWAKDFEILVSSSGLRDEDFVSVHRGRLPNEPQEQPVPFERPLRARFVKLRITSNYGEKNRTSLGEVKILGNLLDSGEGAGKKESEKKEESAEGEKESEDNGSIEKANPLAMGRTIRGEIGRRGDLDYFALDPKETVGGVLKLDFSERPHIKTTITLLNGQGEEVEKFIPQRTETTATISWKINPGKYFLKVEELPARIVAVFDVSSSMKKKDFQNLRKALEGFIRGIQPQEKLMLIKFGGQVKVVSDFANDPDRLLKSLQGHLVPSGQTSLYDAVAEAIGKMKGTRGDRAIVLMTDGTDTASETIYADLWKMIDSNRIKMYTVGQGKDLQKFNPVTGSRGDRMLDSFAAATNGRSFFTSSSEELEGLYRTIAAEIREKPIYSILAKITKPTIEVRVTAPSARDVVRGKTKITAAVKTDPSAPVKKVEFFVDGKPLGTVTRSPWEMAWDAGGQNKKHEVKVVAMNSAGAVDEDSVVTSAEGYLGVWGEEIDGLGSPAKVEFILDVSGSMRYEKDGEGNFKIITAKRIMSKLLQNISDDTDVGLRIFGYDVGRKGGCQASRLEYPISKIRKSTFIPKMCSIVPGRRFSKTAIGLALTQIEGDFRNIQGRKKVILVTDGMEDCHPEKSDEFYPPKVVKRLREKGFEITVDVVGFQIADEGTKRLLKNIAGNTDGKYYDAKNSRELEEFLQKGMGAVFEVIGPNGEKVAEGIIGEKGVPVPEGNYRVNIKSGKPIQISNVRVRPDLETRLFLKKVGDRIAWDSPKVVSPSVPVKRKLGNRAQRDNGRKTAAAESQGQGELLKLICEADSYYSMEWFTAPNKLNALNIYKKVLRRDPSNRYAMMRLDEMAGFYRRQAEAVFASRNYTEAEHFYRKVLEVKPGDQGARKRLNEIQGIRSKIIEQRGVTARYFDLARDSYGKGKYSDAMRYARKGLEADMNHPGLNTLVIEIAKAAKEQAGKAINQRKEFLQTVRTKTLIGTAFSKRVKDTYQVSDIATMQKTYIQALNETPDGGIRKWKNPATGKSGMISMRNTFRKNTGETCREYRQIIFIGSEREVAVGFLACRSSGGRWKLLPP